MENDVSNPAKEPEPKPQSAPERRVGICDCGERADYGNECRGCAETMA